eukprot:CAMPEP_0179057386 /NCGR_PEP_ID=MMETSP0796-20121207/24309_1 /TAXON_ID=73915 /ORGANISM="Pyrodinium bahamense, Strain pbaha01" /LENGTH=105 /DNA_ID=CAMNT_0020754107 /DNA_START=30 /DNA_END=347 /DNA_ORIENTATION=+
MNLRQVISILVSYTLYSHPITFWQLIGLAFVFGALFYKSYLGFHEPPKPKHGYDAADGGAAEAKQDGPCELADLRKPGATVVGASEPEGLENGTSGPRRGPRPAE